MHLPFNILSYPFANKKIPQSLEINKLIIKSLTLNPLLSTLATVFTNGGLQSSIVSTAEYS